MENEKLNYEKISGDLSLEEQIEQVKRHNNPKLVPDMLKNAPCDMIDGATGEFGKVLTNPVPVNGIHGERVYLSFLYCKICNEPLLFHRTGSVQMKTVVVDDYEVCCYKGCTREHLFLAPYFPKRSIYVPRGYSGRVLDFTNPVLRLFIDYPTSLGSNEYVKSFPYGLEEFITFYFGEVVGNPSMVRRRLEKYKEVTEFLKNGY